MKREDEELLIIIAAYADMGAMFFCSIMMVLNFLMAHWAVGVCYAFACFFCGMLWEMLVSRL